MHWIYPTVAGGLFGFGLGSISDAALVLVMDSYRDVSAAQNPRLCFVLRPDPLIYADNR